MKIFLKISAVLILLSIIAVLLFYFSLNRIVKTGILTFVPKTTLTDVGLENSDISVFSGRGELRGLVIGNPKGFSRNNALTLDIISVSIDIASLFSDTVIINEIHVDSPEINYETKGKETNIQTILKNIRSFAKKETPAKKSNGSPPSPGKKFIIHRLEIGNGRIGLAINFLNDKAVSLPLPDITLKDLGKKEGGLTPAEASVEIFGAITGSLKTGVSVSTDTLKEKTGEFLNRLKKRLDK